MVADVAYSLDRVGVCYRPTSLFRRGGGKWALRDISFSVGRGETIGLIGRNGSGKTTLLRLLAGILAPDTGILRTNVRCATLLSLGAGFDNWLTGRENIGMNGRLLGMSADEIATKLPDIISLSGLGEAIDMPVRTYSSGMRSRLGFAIAYFADPDVLLLDENLGVGDEEFQRTSSALIKKKLVDERQTAFLVSHSMGKIREICTRAIWLADGQVRADGDVMSVTREYLDAAARS